MARILTSEESPDFLKEYRRSLCYHLQQTYGNQLPASWAKKSRSNPYRGLATDPDTIPASKRLTAAQKAAQLEHMLGLIGVHCPVVSRNTFNRTTSVEQIWTVVWQHYNLQPPSFDKTNRGKQPNRTYNFSTHTVQNSSTVTHKTANLHNKPPFTTTIQKQHLVTQHTIQKQHMITQHTMQKQHLITEHTIQKQHLITQHTIQTTH